MKKILRKVLPKSVRAFIWRAIPKVHKINTYKLSNPSEIKQKKNIDQRFVIRLINNTDFDKIKKIESYRSFKVDENKLLMRLHSPSFVGIGVFDSVAEEIAYISWIVKNSLPFYEEFGISLKENQYFLKDIYVTPKYRRQGLNSRMEQERVNYCVKQGANAIFIQIHNNHPTMNKTVKNNGYKLYQTNLVIQWPVFNVYRSFKGFITHPFKKVIK